MMQKLFLTVKQWSNYDEEQQEILIKKYDVILTDHKTKQEKVIGILKKFNQKNMNKGFAKFDSVMDQFDTGLKKSFGDSAGDPGEKIFGNKKKVSIF